MSGSSASANERQFESTWLASLALRGKTIIVTGGANGIGFACAELLHRAGAHVALCDISTDLDASLQRIDATGTRLSSHTLDVGSETQIEDTFGAIFDLNGGIYGLVNSAGIAARYPATEVKREVWDSILNINLSGTFLCARHAAKLMINAKASGSIVNISSIFGIAGGRHYPNAAYRASKGGVVNLTRALAVEWAPNKIRVNSVAPGWINTNMSKNVTSNAAEREKIEALVPLKTIAEPSDIANAALFLLSGLANHVTGQILAVDGGYLAQ